MGQGANSGVDGGGITFVYIRGSYHDRVTRTLKGRLTSSIFRDCSTKARAGPRVGRSTIHVVGRLCKVSVRGARCSGLVSSVPTPSVTVSVKYGINYPFVNETFSSG